MRMACIAAFAAACFPASLAAQTTPCPEPPPMSDIQREISAGAEATLLNRFLSGLGLNIEVKTAESENLSRYVDAGSIRKEFHYFSVACKAIMAQPDLSQAQKLGDVEKLARQMLADLRAPASQAPSGAPSAVRPQSAPDKGWTSPPEDPRPSPLIHSLAVDVLADDPEYLTGWRNVRELLAPESVNLLLSLEALGPQYLREVREAVQMADARRVGTGRSTEPRQRADATLDAMADKSRQLGAIASLRNDVFGSIIAAFYLGAFSRDDDDRLRTLRDGMHECSKVGEPVRRPCEAGMLILMGSNYVFMGNDQAAIKTLNQAVALAHPTGDADLLATALTKLGQVQTHYDCSSAKRNLEQAAALSDAVGRSDRAEKK
jgi:hypothetical protein